VRGTKAEEGVDQLEGEKRERDSHYKKEVRGRMYGWGNGLCSANDRKGGNGKCRAIRTKGWGGRTGQTPQEESVARHPRGLGGKNHRRGYEGRGGVTSKGLV